MKKIYRITFKSFVIIFLILIILYFVITNSFFLKQFFIPTIGHFFNTTATVEKIYLSPATGKLYIEGLNLKYTDNYSLEVNKIDIKANIFYLLSKTLKLNHFYINGLNLKITQYTYKNENKTLENNNNDVSQGNFYFDIRNVLLNNINISYNIKRKVKKQSTIIKLKCLEIENKRFVTNNTNAIEFKSNITFNSATGENELKGNFFGTILANINKNFHPDLLDITAVLDIGSHITPIQAKFFTLPKPMLQQTPFAFRFEIKDLMLLPVFKAFVRGNYSDTEGNLSHLIISGKGRDIEKIDFKRNVSGFMAADIKDFDLPVKLISYHILKFIFIPIEVIAHINDFTKSNNIPIALDKVVDTLRKVLKRSQGMHFKNGKVEIVLFDGKMTINKFAFLGGNTNTIRRIVYNGYMNVNGKLNLKTEFSCMGVVVPIIIEGTVEEPKVKLMMILPGIALDTAKNIAVSGMDLALDIGKTVEDSLTNIKENIGAETELDTELTQTTPIKTAASIGKTGKVISKGIKKTFEKSLETLNELNK